jgi:hypothetical protein
MVLVVSSSENYHSVLISISEWCLVEYKGFAASYLYE